MGGSEMEIFRIKDLSFTYPLETTKTLDQVDLTIEKGDFVVLCGQSGCGKTTLIRHLKPLLTPHGTREGELFYKGEKIEEIDQRRQAESIGYVLQNPDSQVVTDKVWHELAFGLESLGYEIERIRLKVAEMAHFFGIQSWFYKDVAQLSGGQKQLLNLASIMAMSPEVLILDEPTSQLDPIGAVDFLETLKKINRELGTTIILTEHRLEEVFKLADRIIVMENGKVMAYDTPEEVCRQLIESNHPMQCALPAPARILGKQMGAYPLTIKEGRQHIENYYGNTQPTYTRVEREEARQQSAVIEAKGVYFKYERQGKDVLKNMNITIHQGELYALVGGNGVGKSTTLGILSQNMKPYRGKVKLKSKQITTLPQNPQTLFVKKTVEEDLKEVCYHQKIDEKEMMARVLAMSELVEIKDYLQRHPYDLSGGEQQRVALAKVLLTQPEILLLDEPTKGLDAHFKMKLAAILRKLQEQGVTIVMVSHDVEFCAQYADRCGMFFDGMIVSEDDARAFFAGNNFYTTSSNRMTRAVYENAVTVEEVITLWHKNKVS